MSPPARHLFAKAYDAERERAILFGGLGGGQVELFDLWAWTGAEWNELTFTGAAPEGRQRHAMAYDVARDRLVLFGGQADDAILDDLWEWDGSEWNELSPSSPPSAAKATR